jgi:hypothetical protein
MPNIVVLVGSKMVVTVVVVRIGCCGCGKHSFGCCGYGCKSVCYGCVKSNLL